MYILKSFLLKQKIKKISIRGRVALTTTCLENASKKLNLNNQELKELIDELWEYISVKHLDEWADKALRNDGPGTYFLKMLEKYQKEKNEKILEVPLVILEIVDAIFLVATQNLSAAVEGYSNVTLEPTLKIMNLRKENHFPIPDLNSFQNLSFKKNKGWGDIVSKNYFQK